MFIQTCSIFIYEENSDHKIKICKNIWNFLEEENLREKFNAIKKKKINFADNDHIFKKNFYQPKLNLNKIWFKTTLQLTIWLK